jgi:hypothetical protein
MCGFHAHADGVKRVDKFDTVYLSLSELSPILDHDHVGSLPQYIAS